MSPSKNGPKKSAKSAAPTSKRPEKFTEEEYGAMRDRIGEMKGGGQGQEAVLAKIAEMGAEDRAWGNRVHAIIMAGAPVLTPRLWYGMPAYAKDDKVVCFFQPAAKFKTRYATLGFSDKANLDDGNMWPIAFALKELSQGEEAKITALVRKAVG